MNGFELMDVLKGYFAGQSDVAATYLFGSQARGDADAKSDIDVLVIFRDPRQPGRTGRRADFSEDLQGLLHTPQVDVVNIDDLTPRAFRVLFRDAVLVYEANEVRR